MCVRPKRNARKGRCIPDLFGKKQSPKLSKETLFATMKNINRIRHYRLATSGGRVPLVVVFVLHGQLRICCVTDSAIL